jgi:hypothetical protein
MISAISTDVLPRATQVSVSTSQSLKHLVPRLPSLNIRRRAQPLKIDEEMYKWRHLIENFFCKLQEFKRIAMRSDKTGSELQSNDLSCRRCLQFRIDLSRP